MSESDPNEIDLQIPGIEGAIAVGLGGNALVYRARQVEFDRTVAVKVLRHSNDERAQLRFDRERRAMGRTTGHPHIAAVYSSGYTPRDEPYLIMPFYDQGSLQDRLDEGPLSLEAAVEIMGIVARAVDYAHSLNIVHRDLKPANILLEGERHPVVTDFGIAQIVGTNVSATALTMTPLFTAPEIFDGVQPSISTDIYSLGASLFALLAGTPAFRGGNDDSMMAIIRRVADEPVPQLGAPIPQWLNDLIAASMSKNPGDRPASAGDFAAVLESAGAVLERPAAPPPAPPPAPPTLPPAEPSPELVVQPNPPVMELDANADRQAEMNRGAVAVTMALLVVAAAVVVGLVANNRGSSTATPSSEVEVAVGEAGAGDDEAGDSDSQDSVPVAAATPTEASTEASVDAEPTPGPVEGPTLDVGAARQSAGSLTLDIVSFGCRRARFDQAIRVSRTLAIAPSELASTWMTRVETGDRTETTHARIVGQATSEFAVIELTDPWPAVDAFTSDTATTLRVWVVTPDGIAGEDVANRRSTDDLWVIDNAQPGTVVWAGEGDLVGIVTQPSGTIERPNPIRAEVDKPTPEAACDEYRSAAVSPDQWQQVSDPAVASFLLAQQLATALANQNWPLARALEPIRATYTDARFTEGWGSLVTSTLIPVQFETQTASVHTWRLGLVGHERFQGRDITVAFCATWRIDLANGTLQQLPDDVFAYADQSNPIAGWVPAGELHDTLFDC